MSIIKKSAGSSLDLRLSLDRLEVGGSVLAQRADKVVGQNVAFINITADLADKALLSFGLRLRLYMLLVVGVGLGFLVAHDSGFGNGADKEAVGAKIHILLYLKGDRGVNIFRKNDQAVVGADRRPVLKFVRGASALEAKVLEDFKGRFYGKAVDV